MSARYAVFITSAAGACCACRRHSRVPHLKSNEPVGTYVRFGPSCTPGGLRLWIKVPWRALGMDEAPKAGATLVLAMTDGDPDAESQPLQRVGDGLAGLPNPMRYAVFQLK